MIRRPPRSTQSRSSAASDVYKRQASVARKWWMGEIVGRAKNADVDPGQLGVQPATIVELNQLVEDGKINNKMATEVLDGVLAGEGTPTEIVAKPVSYTHLRAHETDSYLVCRLLLEK